MDTLDQQLSSALTALIAALCDQPAIDARRLQADYLEAIERISGGPAAVGSIALDLASVIEAIARRREAFSGIDPRNLPKP